MHGETLRFMETSESHLLNERLFYVESSIRVGMTLDEYRRSRARAVTHRERLRRLAGSARTVSARRA